MSLFNEASLVVTPNGYKAGKLYSIKPTSGAGDLDFVRNTAATRVNESGLIESVAANVPRLDYLNGSCPSILIEPQSTNYYLQSTMGDADSEASGYWNFTAYDEVYQTIISIDGTANALQLFYNAHLSVPVKSIITPSTEITISVFFKPFTRDSDSKFLMRNSTTATNFDILVYSHSTGVFSGANWIIEEWQDGWFRLIYTRTSGISISDTIFFYLGDTGAPTFTGYFAMSHAQFETGTKATLPIITKASTVTRNADIATLDPPMGTTEIIETIDGVDNTITTIPATYQISNGRIDKIIMK